MGSQIADVDVDRGIATLLDDYLAIADGDRAFIVYTTDCREAAATLYMELSSRGIPTDYLAMRPLVDPLFRGDLKRALPDPASFPGRLVLIALEKDTMSHMKHIEAVLATMPQSRCTVLRVISASREFFAYSLDLTPDEISRRNGYLLNHFMNARRLRVTAGVGTDLEIELDNAKYEWISNRGMRRDGGSFILPAGEVATYAKSITGVLVADGGFNANISTTHDARLGAHPVTVQIENTEATSFTCDDPTTFRLVKMCFDRAHGTKVGELGFGTNIGIPDFIAMNSHINERRVGVHLGFGQQNQKFSVVKHVADIHLDLITVGAKVWVDDAPEPIDLSTFAPGLTVSHPVVHEEDLADVDCCGLVLGEVGTVSVGD